MEPYKYEALPRDGFMRVLSVTPIHDSRDATIHGSLQIIPIGNASPYVALSYSWGMDGDGDASIYRDIEIDGMQSGHHRLHLFEHDNERSLRPSQ